MYICIAVVHAIPMFTLSAI